MAFMQIFQQMMQESLTRMVANKSIIKYLSDFSA